ncbi:phosphatase PAP2 family protein [Chitinophaga parva]|nr:phosphatase PAP2 family protein [Chitinophaga parva]
MRVTINCMLAAFTLKKSAFIIICLCAFAGSGFARAVAGSPNAVDTLLTDTLPTDTLPHGSPAITAADTTVLYRINSTYFLSIWQDLKYTVARPAHWEKKNWLQFGAVAAGTGVLLGADHSIKQFMMHNQTVTTTHITNQVEPWGNAYAPYLIGVGYLTGVVLHDRKLESGSLMAAKSLVISTAIYTAIKSVVRRGRPTYYDGNVNFRPPFSSDKYHTSFPSGHSNTVMTVATALAELYGKDYPWVPYVAYSVAGLTGITRMYENRHWSSDILVGMALGHFVTQSVFRHYREREHKLALKMQQYH